MAIEFIPPGTEDITAIGAADGNTLKSISGGQRIQNCSRTARTFQALLLGRNSQIRTDISDPFVADFNTNALATTTPSTIADARMGAQAFHFTPGGPAAIVQRVKHYGTSPLHAVGAAGRVYRWEACGGVDVVAAGVRVDEIVLDGSNMRQNWNTNANTDLRLISGSLSTERGFSGTAELLTGAQAIWKRADDSQTLGTGGTMRCLGGRGVWMLGNITTLWLLDGAFDISQAAKDLTIGTLYVSRKMKRSESYKLLSQHATVTLPATVGTSLFVYGDETDDLSR